MLVHDFPTLVVHSISHHKVILAEIESTWDPAGKVLEQMLLSKILTEDIHTGTQR